MTQISTFYKYPGYREKLALKQNYCGCKRILNVHDSKIQDYLTNSCIIGFKKSEKPKKREIEISLNYITIH